MYVPKTEPSRSEKVIRIMEQCQESQAQRQVLYEHRRRWMLFGTDGIGRPPRYNKLGAHTELVASFLYAADHAAFDVAAPRNSESAVVKQMLAVQDDWNDDFRDSGVALDYAQVLQWALCYDSMFLKVGYNESRQQVFTQIVPPHNFGVYDETQGDLDSQQAFTHTYSIDYDDALLRLQRGGMMHRVSDLQQGEVQGNEATTPNPVALMLASGQRTSMNDPLTGQVSLNFTPQSMYDPTINTNRVLMTEVWIWDDAAKGDDGEAAGDYVFFKVLGNGIVLEDSRESIDARVRATGKSNKRRVDMKSLRWTDTNDFLPREHPFVHICPFPIYNYFWGEAHTDRLIPLQEWLNDRLWEIKQLLALHVNPPRNYAGFMGLLDEKADAFGTPGTWVADQTPGAKVDNLAPELPQDLFQEVLGIDALFLEASGLTQTMMGRGEQGVRGRSHARQLATTGSSRIRKTAVGLEPSLVRLADVSLRLRQIWDDRRLMADNGMEFVLAQTAAPWRIRIAGHSHSPLFADESRELAERLFKAQAIDREMLLRMMRPAGEAMLLHSLKQRQSREQRVAATHPELLKKGSKGSAAIGQAAA